MKRQANRLTTPEIKALAKPGRYADGGGLYLVVDASGARRWIFLFRWAGRRQEMGLGGFPTVTLAKAREKAREAGGQLGDDVNPIAARKALRTIPTFAVLANEVLALKAAGFRREKSSAIWKRTIETYAAELGPQRVDRIDTSAVVKAMRPIWDAKPETGHKARGVIEAVLDAAKVKRFRSGENPAAWRGNLEHLLPKRRKLTRGHQRALPFTDAPAFMRRLREHTGMAALALEFAILCASRTGEVLGATWDEINLSAQVWTIPAQRMKSGREHRVPLTDPALSVLAVAGEGRKKGPGDLVFPGPCKRGALMDRPLSTNAMRATLLRMKAPTTVHGFRSSFRDWAGEVSTFPREIAEGALSHVVGDETERAYRRGDALAKRRKLMDAWANFISQAGAPANVHPLRRTGV